MTVALFCSNYPKESSFKLDRAAACQKQILTCFYKVSKASFSFDAAIKICTNEYLEQN